MDIYQHEQSTGVVVSVGGQIPQNLAMPLYNAGTRLPRPHRHWAHPLPRLHRHWARPLPRPRRDLAGS